MSENGDDRTDGAGEPGRRIARAEGERGRSLGERISQRLARIGYATPVHGRRLKGRPPLKILATAVDPIGGDAAAGALILAGTLSRAGHSEALRGLDFAALRAPAEWHDWLAGFGWLRDLVASGDRKKAAAVAADAAQAFLARFRDYDEAAWRGDLAGRRLLFWILHAPLVLSRAEPTYRSLVLNHLARVARHLDGAWEKTADGLPRLEALGGLVAAGLMLPEGEQRLTRAEAALDRVLELFVLTDGEVASRRPSDLLALVELLLALQSLYTARGFAVAQPIADALGLLAPGLKALLLGDGRLAAMNGGNACASGRVAHVLGLLGSATRLQRNAEGSGLQRLAEGRTTIIADCGPPPAVRYSAGAHAGTLAFELSDGDTRMIVNCGGDSGAPELLPAKLRHMFRMTAAHSTLVLADTNSTQLKGGALGRGVAEVVVLRQDSDRGSWLDAAHDGYARSFGFQHRRRLFLSADGRDFRGEDALLPIGSRRLPVRRKPAMFDIRFHLGPGVEATPTADAKGALVKLPTGKVWQFKVRGGEVIVDDSLWVDESGRTRSIRQIVVGGQADTDGASVNWSFKRAGQ